MNEFTTRILGLIVVSCVNLVKEGTREGHEAGVSLPYFFNMLHTVTMLFLCRTWPTNKYDYPRFPKFTINSYINR